MSDMTIGDVVAAMMEQPEARALISESAGHDLHRVGHALPARSSRAFGFEIRMDADEDRTDLFLRVESYSGGRDVLLRKRPDGLREVGEGHPAWEAIGRLCDAWQRDEASPWRNVRQIWFEFDVKGQGERIPVPAMCFWHGGSVDHLRSAGPAGLDPRPHVELTRSATLLLQGKPLSADVERTLERCIRSLPRGGQVFCIGVMMERRTPRLRLCLKGIPAGAHIPYLHEIGFGKDERYVPVVELATALADEVQLALDVGGTIGPKLHLELRCDPNRSRDARLWWRGLVGQLLGRGLVGRRRARAFVEWLGPHWVLPVDEEGRAQAWSRRVSHVKLAWSPDEGVRAKGYLGLSRPGHDAGDHANGWTPSEKLVEAQRLRRAAAAAHAAGRTEDALERERSALRLCEQATGPRHPAVGHCLNGVGAMLHGLGRTDEALSHYRRALSVFEAGAHPDGSAVALINIGKSRLLRGEPALALEPLERALERLEGTHAPAPWLRECCMALVRALEEAGAPEAEWSTAARRAIAAFEE